MRARVGMIKLLLLDMPAVLKCIVEESFREMQGVEIVAARDSEELEAALEEHQPDVVLIGSAVDDREGYASLLWSHPRLKILTLLANGNEAVGYEMRPTRVALAFALTPRLLAAIVGEAVDGGRWPGRAELADGASDTLQSRG